MGSLVSCFSNILYISERITLCFSYACLVLCLVLTIAATLLIGIGLGYNYCFVEMQNRFRHSLRSHYVFPPGHPIGHPPKRDGDEPDYPELEGLLENDASRRSPQLLPDGAKRDSPLRSAREDLRSDNLTGIVTINYGDIFSDPESSNRTEASVGTSGNVTRKDESTIISQNNSDNSVTTEELEEALEELEVISRISDDLEKSSTIVSTTEDDTEVLSVISKSAPESIDETIVQIVNDLSSREEKKLVIPIASLDLISLLTKLSAENRNYSLQIVST